MKSKTKKEILLGIVLALGFFLIYLLTLDLLGLDGCMVSKYKLIDQLILENKECQTESGKCLFLVVKPIIFCGGKDIVADYTKVFIFQKEDRLLNISSGSEIYVRWCDIYVGSPNVKWRIRGVWKA